MQLPEESCRVIFFQFCFSRGDFLVNSTTNKDVTQKKKINVRSIVQDMHIYMHKDVHRYVGH